ncbi:hypothetical protein ATY81_27545 [Rhizobium sp. R72]|uniref:hypothetical protein n=1 Tax=unclassified Rhizobium TaxID=2613769 RepID=UPI000B531A8F|nr:MULTISPECIES: hypothetical protein [unclassified Rhizobium]OWV96922.1 hypothetical protein ATY81_27545 [Rhizobium sp. R72]OWV96932.1 hypothetical protein ATY80_27545 [Rhizobium sp. R711]
MTSKNAQRPMNVTATDSIAVKARSSISDLEDVLADARWPGPEQRHIELKLPGSVDSEVLSDVWAGILVGSLSAKHALRLLGWGLSEITPASRISTSPAFLNALSSAASIAPELGQDIDSSDFRRQIALLSLGLVDPNSGLVQTLVEFDPEYSVAPSLRGGGGFVSVSLLDRKRIFEQLVLEFRKRLEVGAIRHGITPVNSGPAGDIGKFLAELHENAYEHGSRDNTGRAVRGTRTMRIRKYIANNKRLLLDRCGSFGALAQHVDDTFSDNTAAPALIEASVSDFGLGIVDGFLSSDVGRSFQTVDRRTVLEALIYDQLSSKGSDPSAGLGLQKALDAAKKMGAFVSLRTGEFWLTVSFAANSQDARLADVSDAPRGMVAGTHWQILWSQS